MSKEIKIFKVSRAIYGKKGTPLELREYKMDGVTSVGNRSDWKKFAGSTGFNVVRFIELDGKYVDEPIDS